MTETALQRVARAMERRRMELIAQPLSRVYGDLARAAFEEMRHYTPAMIEAGLKEISDCTVQEPKAAAWDAIRFHKAAINAALSEPTTRERGEVELPDLAVLNGQVR